MTDEQPRWDDDLPALLAGKDSDTLKNAVGVAFRSRDEYLLRAAKLSRLAAKADQEQTDQEQVTQRRTELENQATAYLAAAGVLDEGLHEALMPPRRSAAADTPKT